MVTISTASLTFNNSTFCPHCVFVCFVWIWEKTAIISLYNINWLVCITETECFFYAVRTQCVWTPYKPNILTLQSVTQPSTKPDTKYTYDSQQYQISSLYGGDHLRFRLPFMFQELARCWPALQLTLGRTAEHGSVAAHQAYSCNNLNPLIRQSQASTTKILTPDSASTFRRWEESVASGGTRALDHPALNMFTTSSRPIYTLSSHLHGCKTWCLICRDNTAWGPLRTERTVGDICVLIWGNSERMEKTALQGAS